MKYDPQYHHRRSIRLREYDYSSPGAYFVTVCTHNKQCLFGEIVDGQMRLNQYGEVVQEEWLRSASIRKEIQLDACVVMPNHVHGIVIITSVGAHGDAPSIVTSPVGPHGGESTSAVSSAVGTHGHVPSNRTPRGNTSASIVTPAARAHRHAPLHNAPPPQRRPRSLGTFVSGFKSAVKVRVNKMRGMPGAPVWQSNYYEHVVRNEEELNRIREYILTNPLRWALDRENPACRVGAHGHAPQQEPE